MALGRSESERDRLDVFATAIRKGNADAVQLKVRLLGEARTKLVQNQVGEDLISAAGIAAEDHFHNVQSQVMGEVHDGDKVDAWDLLDSIELADCGQKAVERAQELGVTNVEILRLFLDFGMRMADFCFAQEVEQLPV